MAVIPMSLNQKSQQDRADTIDHSCTGFTVLHHPADQPSLRSLPFVCIGQEISVLSDGLQFCISGIFLSPAGDVSIILEGRPSPSDLPRIIKYLRGWDYAELDAASSDYTYLNSGQAYRIIDIMAKHGHLKFSDAQVLSDAVSRNMKNGSFYLLYTDGSI